MATDPGTEPIDDDELLLRRIPVSTGWYTPPNLSPQAFDPNKSDDTGLSINRKKYVSPEDLARRGRPGKQYYVAVIRAGDLAIAGLEAVPRPLDNDPGHAELPALTYNNRKSDFAVNAKSLLATVLLATVEGPFTAT